MITRSKKVFTTSINLKFDIGNKEFVQRYLPTPSHADFLKGIIGGFLGERKKNAHIMIGPYGSGKSLAATIVADIFSESINDRDFNRLIDKFKDVDQEIFEKLNAAKQSNESFIPVVLSGNEGPFSQTIINSIVKSVKNAGFHIDVPGEVERIYNVLESWESVFPKTFNSFKKSLKEHGYTLIQWKKEVNSINQEEIKWFIKEYSNLSAGANFQIDYTAGFIDNIAHIIAQLKEQNLKIFIAYDEFGRFLQSLETSQIYKTMQDLQDLAEVADRSENTLQLLLISHKNMSQYMLGHNEEFKAEFQRIEKRFKTYFVESDKATFYRIAQEYTKSMQKELMLLNLESADSKWILKKYNLFSELNHQETEKLIVEGSYPLHPLALFLLPRLSNVFGQNERTLFTFLESEETGGLTNFVTKQKEGMYYPHMLFDYFFRNSMNEFLGDENFDSLKTFAKVTNKMKITKQNKGQIDLLKIITLWDLSGATNVLKLNDDLLMFGTGQIVEELKTNLKKLVQQKMLRFNRILGRWELNEGSSVLVDEMLNEERKVIKINNENRLDMLKGLLERKFYLATDYNDEKNITRFMQVNLLTSEQLLEDSFLKKIEFDADGYIYYVIPTDEVSYLESLSKIASIKNKRLIFSITDKNFKSIQTSLDKLIVMESIYSNKKLLSENSRLEEEISVLLAEIQFEISGFLKDFENFQENIKWFYKAVPLNVNHQVQLENSLSEIMYEIYPDTPEIRNDSINRRNLNGMQTKAIHTVLNNVIKNPSFERLGIEGQGPDYLIYATVFKNNNLDVSHLSRITYGPYNQLRKSILNFIVSNKEGSVLELENIFTSYPFGIRKPLIPLLFAGLLRDVWEQLMFYRNGMYVTAIDAEKLYGMFKEPTEYQYVFNDYSPEFLTFVRDVEKIFHSYESEYVREQTIVIMASSGLLNWLRQLPRHTQTTNKINDDLLEFKNLVRKIEVNPITSLEMLKDKFSEAQALVEMKAELERHFSRFENELIDKLLETFGVNSLEELERKRKNFSASLAKRNRLLKSICAESENFTREFALNYTGIELENWSDTTFDLFVRQMQNDYRDMEMSSDDSDTILLGYGDSQKSIKKVELSNKANTVYENVNRIINNAGRSVPREEIEYLIFKLLEEYIE
ncbi:hypothetical protein BBH88_04560 [Planococcus antarcticus DSM 14505]|uniref:AAA+ ATPase domain-containing protein n=1 Tax=Planococcus antarcticus DSM 14505 TaxID=1185653 RepID=A0ABN4RC14_9BACL|nr:hypothetical protein [Planococcus antarcticus]ANU09619.1 hypothetical protein BBH88_04560 [Planococcus antarcticus DSM 14505]